MRSRENTRTKVWKKVQQKLLHFFVRYAIMYHSDEQMSLIRKQKRKSVFVGRINVFGGRIWKAQRYTLL